MTQIYFIDKLLIYNLFSKRSFFTDTMPFAPTMTSDWWVDISHMHIFIVIWGNYTKCKALIKH